MQKNEAYNMLFDLIHIKNRGVLNAFRFNTHYKPRRIRPKIAHKTV